MSSEIKLRRCAGLHGISSEVLTFVQGGIRTPMDIVKIHQSIHNPKITDKKIMMNFESLPSIHAHDFELNMDTPTSGFDSIKHSLMTNTNVNIGMILSSTSSSDIEEIKSFEPVVNVPALSSFLLIVVIFSFLQIRINGIEKAVERRNVALQRLREVKSNQLAGVTSLSTNDINISNGASTNNMIEDEKVKMKNENLVELAKEEYANALKNEEDLRTIIPGVRIAAPNRPDASDENIAAAKQFLNIDLRYDDDKDIKNMNENSSKSMLSIFSNQKKDVSNEPSVTRGFSSGAIAVMLLVATSQIALLYMLSFDPMKANDVFTSISGPPPTDLPLSSW